MEIYNEHNIFQTTGRAVTPKPDTPGKLAAHETSVLAEPSLTPAAGLEDAIKLLGFTPNENNIGLAAALLKNSLPVTRDNMTQLNRAVKLSGNMQESVFLLQNNMKINAKTVSLLKGVASREITVLATLSDIAALVDALPEGSPKQTLTAILTGEAPAVPDSGTLLPETPVALHQTTDFQGEPLSTSAMGETQNIAGKTVPDLPAALNETEPAAESETVQPLLQDEPEPDALILSKNNNVKLSADTLIKETENTIGSVNIIPGKTRVTEETISPAPGQTLSEYDTKTDYSTLFPKLLKKYTVRPETDTPKEIDERMNNLKESLHEAQRTMQNEPSLRENTPLRDGFDKLSRTLEMLNDAQKAVFAQFPVSVNGNAENAELYVFRDKSRKTSKNAPNQSALIALDFPYLGHFEAYIQRNGSSVNCRFKASDETKSLIAETISQFSEMLESKGYRLDGFSFSKLNEPFSILNKEPVDDSPENNADIELFNIDFKA